MTSSFCSEVGYPQKIGVIGGDGSAPGLSRIVAQCR